MRYATMRGQGGVTVTIPKLEGGVNLSDLPTQVEDNQLTAVNNMWWHQGVLRTRPGLRVLERHEWNNLEIVSRLKSSDNEEIITRRNDWGLFSVVTIDDQGQMKGIQPFTLDGNTSADHTLSVKVGNGKYLTYVDNGDVYKDGSKVYTYEPKISVSHLEENGAATSVSFEGANLLNDRFSCSFTSNGGITSYQLPKISRQRIFVEVQLFNFSTKKLRTLTAIVDPGAEGDETTNWEQDGIAEYEMYETRPANMQSLEPWDFNNATLHVTVNWKTRYLSMYFSASYTVGVATFMSLPFVTSNNITVTASLERSADERAEIAKMTKAVWFGGAREGLDGGTRLFVAGHPGKPNLVRWSDVNNPLYFPENNYFYVGDATQRITGFGKQGNQLIIFKEREIYCTQYVEGNTVTADNLVSGAVTDITVMTAQFPLMPIHTTIGCDCPESVRLVNNRLVWATSDAHVYMLTGTNQFSEQNVRDITALIHRDLSKQDIGGAMAAEYKGHYMLVLPNGRIYVLDVGNSAFQSYAHYASEKKANRALPWYIWEICSNGERVRSVISCGEKIALYLYDEETDIETAITFDGDTDEGEPIPCSFTTKLFDFGCGDVKKAITHLYLGVADSPTNTVRVSYITDAYTAEDAYIIESGGDHNEREPGYIRTHRLTPNIHRVRLFGIRCDSEGAMAVDGIQIKTKPQGVVR